MKTNYQTVTFADITLTASAQAAISAMQLDTYKVICENLDDIALLLCEQTNVNLAWKNLGLIHSVLMARELVYKIGTKEEE